MFKRFLKAVVATKWFIPFSGVTIFIGTLISFPVGMILCVLDVSLFAATDYYELFPKEE